MTDAITAGILGIVEGLTEYLPVSSTGHLILVGRGLQFANGNTATFDIAIQLGAILAVVVLFRAYFLSLLNPKTWFSAKGKVLATACFPVMVVGLLTHHWIKLHLFNPITVAAALIVGAIIMLIVEKLPSKTLKTTKIEDITIKQALMVGLCQCFALWPGMSRSASTITGGILAGLSYEIAAEFSFLIAVPVMTAAVAFDMIKSAASLTTHEFGLIGIGFVVSFVVAMLSIEALISILKRYRFFPFALYRIALGAFLLYVLL